MHAEVQRYYGEVLASTDDLRTSACCTAEAPPDFLRTALAQIHDEVLSRYYGCGLVLPEVLDGAQVLDLGCGAGRDVYVLAQLVGAGGRVVGVDMTPEQLDVARRHRDHHAQRFGHRAPNVEFIEGHIEHLDRTGLAAGRFDVIVSNCVINLAMDKQAVLNEAYRLLKPGGELYFADVYADRRIPGDLREDPVLYGECLAGALYWNDFLQIAFRAGFTDPRLVTDRPLAVEDAELAARVGDIRFYSATYRLFKLAELERGNEDYGQSVRYRGSAPHHPDRFTFDKYHVFETGRSTPVSGNTACMLAASRLAPHFEVSGDTRHHRGPFVGPVQACGTAMPFDAGAPAGTGCC
ncbi:MAG: methyltransferase domain-containing protein [Gammaproteobacteria bacterium]